MTPNGLTRIQIDCGHTQTATANGMFSSMPLGSQLHTPTNANTSTRSSLLPTHVAKEQATEAEREMLLSGDANKDDGKHHRMVLLDRNTRLSIMCCAIACTLLTVTLVVLLALIFDRVNSTVAEVDKSVSIASTARLALANVNSILNSTARVTNTIDRLGGMTFNAAMFTTPYLGNMLNVTQDTMNDLHRLVERPTISIGAAGGRYR